jgi:anaerobic selenocysteine-containing dehydrogenase
MEGDSATVRLHPETAKTLNLQTGDMAVVKQGLVQASLPVMCDERVPEQAAWIAGGIEATASLGDLFGAIELRKI